MIPPARGATAIVTLLPVLLLLALVTGCAGPMSQREAESTATRRISHFCGRVCGAWHITGAQRMKDRWLVDFDAPRYKLSVLVKDSGATDVTVWNKK